MSESLVIGILLVLSGGYLDAYSFLCRDGVFANAQTGNIALLGIGMAQRDWEMIVQYGIPVLVFAVGVYVAARLKWSWQQSKAFHWRQIILAIEIVLLFCTAFMGSSLNWLANSLISFVCALQTESFRKIRGNVFATTMCTGNLRSAAELMYSSQRTADKVLFHKSMLYYGLVFLFALGAMIGGMFTKYLSYYAVLPLLYPLAICFMLMFHEEESEGHPLLSLHYLHNDSKASHQAQSHKEQ